MRTLGSKVEMHARAQTRGANDLIWARMDFRYGGDYTELIFQVGSFPCTGCISEHHPSQTAELPHVKVLL